jgi:2-methylcitrate dehydratase PrpD
MSITGDVAEFVKNVHYNDLPSRVVQETKRLFLDSMGCALGGIKTQKGEIAMQLARSLGGPAEASLLGVREKVSAASSAFATGELLNALDYEALLSPPDHATPYVMAAPLALGEMNKASGSELIVALAVAHELATRIGSSLVFGKRFAVELPERGMAMSLPTPGYGLCTFAGAAAAGRLAGLKTEKIAHAMGIAGYSAPVPMLMKFATTTPASMSKYLPAGILSQTQVMAVLLADMGYTGDTEVLDGNYGFWRAFGCDGWRPEYLTGGLGTKWHFPERIFYKTFPCCGAMQNVLAHVHAIVTEHDLRPGDIDGMTVRLNALAELPAWKMTSLSTHIDVQFSVPFVLSLVTHRIEPGPSWQVPETMKDEGIIRFMEKVTIITDLDDDARHRPDVEITVGTGTARKVYEKRGLAPGHATTDTELFEKFKGNTGAFLNEAGIQKIVDVIQNLEHCSDIAQLFPLWTDGTSK